MRMVVMLEKLEMVLSCSDMRELAERLRRDVVRATVHDPVSGREESLHPTYFDVGAVMQD